MHVQCLGGGTCRRDRIVVRRVVYLGRVGHIHFCFRAGSCAHDRETAADRGREFLVGLCDRRLRWGRCCAERVQQGLFLTVDKGGETLVSGG